MADGPFGPIGKVGDSTSNEQNNSYVYQKLPAKPVLLESYGTA